MPRPAPTTDAIVTDRFRVWLRSDGVVQIAAASGNKQVDADAARNAIEACNAMADGVPRGLLVDMRHAAPMDRRARVEFAAPHPFITAIALWVDSPLSVVVANFFIGVSRPANPVRLFTDEAKAIAWLDSRRRAA